MYENDSNRIQEEEIDDNATNNEDNANNTKINENYNDNTIDKSKNDNENNEALDITLHGLTEDNENIIQEGEMRTVFSDPLNFNVKHPLYHEWTLWFDNPGKKASTA